MLNVVNTEFGRDCENNYKILKENIDKILKIICFFRCEVNEV